MARPGASAGAAGGGTQAFTLVELMTVIGLLVVLAAGLSPALRREGNAGMALRTARHELAMALQLAQRTAQVRQLAVRLCVSLPPAPGQPSAESSRAWWLEGAEGADWVPLRVGGEFAPGTCIVPEETAKLRLRSGIVWPEGGLSQLDVAPAADGRRVGRVEFRTDGAVVGGPRRLLVALTDEAPGEPPRLADPAAVLAVRVLADGRIEEGAP